MSSPPFADDSSPAEWHDTFAALCERHRPRLVRWLTAIFGPRDAEDIAQETFARLYARPGLVTEDADAWPWLSVVARNVGRDLARHNAWSTAVDTQSFAAVPDDAVLLDEVVLRDEGARLAGALRRLTPRERTVIRLRDLEDRPVADIAALLGISENAVRQQLFRARRRLATVYVELGGDSRFGALVAAVGVRLRELARRYVPFADTGAAPAAAAVLALLPGLAGAFGGALAHQGPGLGSAGAGVRAAATVLGAPGDARDADPPHGTGGLLPALAAPPGGPAAVPGRPAHVEVHQRVPFGRVDLTYDRGPFEPDDQESNPYLVEVREPVTGRYLRVRGGEYGDPEPDPYCLVVIPCP
jgi:RNA polymerase sigma factor (sigma-70 family)